MGAKGWALRKLRLKKREKDEMIRMVKVGAAVAVLAAGATMRIF
jgi:hypothetical protein